MEKTDKSAEEIIENVIGIRPGAPPLTPTDYAETKLCMQAYAAQQLSEYKERLKHAVKSEPSDDEWTIEEIITLIDMV